MLHAGIFIAEKSRISFLPLLERDHNNLHFWKKYSVTFDLDCANLCGNMLLPYSSLQRDQKHLTMAHLFDKPCFLGPLGLHVSTQSLLCVVTLSFTFPVFLFCGISKVICVSFFLQADDFSGLHANTHLPVLVGAQKRYEVVGDQLYKVTWMLVRVLTVCYPVVLFFHQQYKHAQVPFSLQFQFN
jgi:hypothetical protein